MRRLRRLRRYFEITSRRVFEGATGSASASDEVPCLVRRPTGLELACSRFSGTGTFVRTFRRKPSIQRTLAKPVAPYAVNPFPTGNNAQTHAFVLWRDKTIQPRIPRMSRIEIP